MGWWSGPFPPPCSCFVASISHGIRVFRLIAVLQLLLVVISLSFQDVDLFQFFSELIRVFSVDGIRSSRHSAFSVSDIETGEGMRCPMTPTPLKHMTPNANALMPKAKDVHWAAWYRGSVSSPRPFFDPELLKTTVDTVTPTGWPSCGTDFSSATCYGEIFWIGKLNAPESSCWIEHQTYFVHVEALTWRWRA